MAIYTVKAYYNTGLYIDNCLENLSMLDLLGYKSINLESVFLLQNRNLIEIKVAANYETIKDIDYCVIGDTGYWVNSIVMLNENACSLGLQTDYITSIGIDNITIIDGWATRRSVLKDNYFDNTLQEPFTPTMPLVLDFGAVVKPSTMASDNYRIVVSTVDLMQISYTAKTYVDEADDLFKVTVPQIPVVTGEETETTFYMGDYSYKLPKASCYNYDKVNEGIQAVRSLGIENCIIASYTIPANYVSLGNLENTRHGKIGGINETDKKSKLNPIYSQVKNKKALTGQFTTYVLMSLITGEKQTFPVEEIINSNNEVSWKLLSDPLPEGYPIIMPAYFHRMENNAFFGSVRGANWQQNPIQYTQKSGAAIAEANYSRTIAGRLENLGQKISNFAGYAYGTLQGAASVVAPVAAKGAVIGVKQAIGEGVGLAAGAAKGATGALSAGGAGLAGTAVAGAAIGAFVGNYWYNSKKFEFHSGQNIVVPEIPYSPVHSLQNYYGNFFQEFRYRLSNIDLANFDNFLSAYGYAVSEPLTKECFTGRTNFNYIESTNVLIKTNRSKIETMGATEQLTNGVRIWHTNPTQEKLFNNPIGGSKNVD